MGRGRLLPAFFIARAGPLMIRNHQAALTFPPVSLMNVNIVAVRPWRICIAHSIMRASLWNRPMRQPTEHPMGHSTP